MQFLYKGPHFFHSAFKIRLANTQASSNTVKCFLHVYKCDNNTLKGCLTFASVVHDRYTIVNNKNARFREVVYNRLMMGLRSL